jgi:hypothetical protein
MKKFWQKLKIRWGIKSDWQVGVILLVFTLTGFSFLFINPLIDEIFGITKEDPFWIKALIFIVIILPVYNILLITWGTILGQHKFFRNFIVAFFRRILFMKKSKK